MNRAALVELDVHMQAQHSQMLKLSRQRQPVLNNIHHIHLQSLHSHQGLFLFCYYISMLL